MWQTVELTHVAGKGTLQNVAMLRRERELRSVTDRRRLQNVDVWQRERD